MVQLCSISLSWMVSTVLFVQLGSSLSSYPYSLSRPQVDQTSVKLFDWDGSLLTNWIYSCERFVRFEGASTIVLIAGKSNENPSKSLLRRHFSGSVRAYVLVAFYMFQHLIFAVIMILRVYALYGRSITIIVFLLLLWAAQIVVSFIGVMGGFSEYKHSLPILSFY